MSSKELSVLYQLHLIDAAIVEIRKHAAALDPGREFMQQQEVLKLNWKTLQKKRKDLEQELKELEHRQHQQGERIKKIDQEMYSPKTSAREIELLQKEIASIKSQQKVDDSRILELWELVSPAKEKEEKAYELVLDVETKLIQHRKEVLKEKERLELEFKEKSYVRPQIAAKVDPVLLKQYNAIKEKNGGTGMALVREDGACGGCGMNLSVRAIEYVNMDKVVTCESCGRILFKVVPDL